MMKEEQESHDQDSISIYYEEDLPFSIFESEAMKKALRRLNLSYKSSIRQKVPHPILEIAYSKMQSKVDVLII